MSPNINNNIGARAEIPKTSNNNVIDNNTSINNGPVAPEANAYKLFSGPLDVT